MDNERIDKHIFSDKEKQNSDIGAAFSEFFQFLRKPRFDWNQKGKESFISLHIIFLAVFFIMLFVATPLLALVGVDNMDNSLDDLMTDYPKWVFVLLAVVLAPLMEEFLFRFHLRYPRVGLGLFLIALVTMIVSMSWDLFDQVWIVGAIGLLMTLYGLFIFQKFKGSIKHIYTTHFPIIFYGTVLVFAFMHIFNYQGLEIGIWRLF